MKKTITASTMLVLLAAGVLLYSCKKEHPLQTAASPQDGYNVSVQNNLIAFKTVEDYKAIVDNPSSEAKATFAEHVSRMNNFIPMSRTAAEERLNSDYEDIDNGFLRGILNKDAAVQIGDYIYKISVKKEKVFVIHKSDINDYKDVVSGDTKNKKVRVFSINDEVLSLTGNAAALGKGNGVMDYEDDGGGGGGSSGGGGGGGQTCETGIGDKSAYGSFDDNGSHIDASARYDRFGIYFSLYALIDGVPSFDSPYDFDFTGGIPANAGYVYYAKRQQCNTPVSYPILDPGIYKDGNTQEYPSYQGSRSLNEVYFYFRVKHKYSYTYFTNYIGFRQNK